MGIFTRRRPVVVEDAAWHLRYDDYEILDGEDTDMDDDGQVMASAYRVEYQREDVPWATLAVCVYATYGPSENGTCYMTGYRCEQDPGDGAEPWVLYDHVRDSELYYDLEEADEAARAAAESLTAVPRDPAWDDALPFLTWDGTPW